MSDWVRTHTRSHGSRVAMAKQEVEPPQKKVTKGKFGWPDSIQVEGVSHTYEWATQEWAERMSWSKGSLE